MNLSMEKIIKSKIPGVTDCKGRFRRNFVWIRPMRIDGVVRANEPCPRKVCAFDAASYDKSVRTPRCTRIGHKISIFEAGKKTIFRHDTYTVARDDVDYHSRVRGYIDDYDKVKIEYILLRMPGVSGLTYVTSKEGQPAITSALLDI